VGKGSCGKHGTAGEEEEGTECGFGFHGFGRFGRFRVLRLEIGDWRLEIVDEMIVAAVDDYFCAAEKVDAGGARESLL
jgi:hypothetical protein